MAREIVIQLPEFLAEQVEQIGAATQRDLQTVLSDSLELLWLTMGQLTRSEICPPIENLSNVEVLQVADSKLAPSQNERLGYLQTKGKIENLTEPERYELLSLLQIYQLGQLRQAQALAEAVRRGLKEPLTP